MKSQIKKLIPYKIGQKLRGIWQKSQSLYYKGETYHCPFCKNSFRKMLNGGSDLAVIKEKNIVGAGLRSNCVCPRCYSTDRDRLIYLYLMKHSPIFKDKLSLLHIAPSGSLKAMLKSLPNIKYNSGVKYHEGFYYSKDIMLFDITDLSYDDNLFDVIFCNHVLEHIIDDTQAMKELYRVLKPGGWAILQVPISTTLEKTYEDPSITLPSEREIHFGQFDHVRIYGQDYADKLSEVGFRVNKFNSKERFKDDDINRYAINKDEILYVAYKD